MDLYIKAMNKYNIYYRWLLPIWWTTFSITVTKTHSVSIFNL